MGWKMQNKEDLKLLQEWLRAIGKNYSLNELLNLRELHLSDNGLQLLPPEIKYLTNLQWLRLGSNELRLLPQEIKYLTNLQGLHLGGNKLRSLPQEIKYLTNLQWLHLGGKKLSIPDHYMYDHLKFAKIIANLHHYILLKKYAVRWRAITVNRIACRAYIESNKSSKRWGSLEYSRIMAIQDYVSARV